MQNYTQSHSFLTQSIDILSRYHHQDMNIAQLIKYFHYERLLVELSEALSRQTFTDNDKSLWEKCQSFLTENHSENGKFNLLDFSTPEGRSPIPCVLILCLRSL